MYDGGVTCENFKCREGFWPGSRYLREREEGFCSLLILVELSEHEVAKLCTENWMCSIERRRWYILCCQ